jgi:hypothetical protein
MRLDFVSVGVEGSNAAYALTVPQEVPHRRTLTQLGAGFSRGGHEQMVQNRPPRTKHRNRRIDGIGSASNAHRSEIQGDRFDERAAGPSQSIQQTP